MHRLNLSASRAISIPAIQHAGVVWDVANCFRSSAKRTDLLKRCIQEDAGTRSTMGTNHQLVTLCDNRFVERHTAVITLRSLLPFVMEALDSMKT